MARDLLEDRLEWHGHLRGYIKDVLQLTPMLSQSGVQVDAIQDSIRNASKAMDSREYEDARKLLDLRRQETRLWKQLWSFEEYVTKRVKVKPLVELMVLTEPDKHLLDAFTHLRDDVEDMIQEGRQMDALRRVEEFLSDDVSTEYLSKEGKRLETKDEAAWFVVWSVGLGLLKLVAPVVPNLAEEFYQQYFRDREGSPSVHTVDWPEPFAGSGKPSKESGKAAKKHKGAK